jgi:hypothetical protein
VAFPGSVARFSDLQDDSFMLVWCFRRPCHGERAILIHGWSFSTLIVALEIALHGKTRSKVSSIFGRDA